MKKNIICPQCGASNMSENIFCSECGTPLKQESAPKGEPKTVTNRRVNHSKPIKKIIGSICVRSEERRVAKECVSEFRYPRSPYN